MPTGSSPTNLPSDMCTLRQAFAIANRAVVSDIETEAVATTADFGSGTAAKCWDTRPMLDPRECAPECIDMATEALAYAERCGLIERHPHQRYLVRLRGGGL